MGKPLARTTTTTEDDLVAIPGGRRRLRLDGLGVRCVLRDEVGPGVE